MASKIHRIRLDEQMKSLEYDRIHFPRYERRVDVLCGSTLPYADNGDLYRPKQTPGAGSSHSLRGQVVSSSQRKRAFSIVSLE